MVVKWLIGLLAMLAMGRCEREEQFKVKMDCSKYGAGNYVFGCNPHYWVCINSFQQYELRCYGDLVLDPDENRCNYREKVRLCTDPNLPRSQPYRALELFSCKNRNDGMYSTGFCDNYFHTCTKGTKQDNPCPYQQYFDTRTKKCDYREKVDECSPENLKTRPLAQPAVPIRTDQSGPMVQTIENPEKADLVPPPVPRVMPNGKSLRIGMALPTDVNIPGLSGVYQRANNTTPVNMPDCSRLPESLFENDVGQCSNLFWKCSNKLASQWKCPEGLFFNIENKQCDFVENIAACGGSRGGKPDTTEDVFGSGIDAPLMPVLPTQQPMVDFNCTGRMNGYYIEKPCQTTYVHCTDGKTEVKNCAPGSLFDSGVADCRPKAECGSMPRPLAPVPAPIESGQSFPQDLSRSAAYPSPYGQAPQYNPPVTPPVTTVKPTTPPDLWCRQNNKPDGFHGVGCAPYFYSCTFGFSQKIQCPAGLFYDPEVHECSNKEWIPVCGGKKPTTTMAPQLDPNRPTTTPDPWCARYNMPDGLHAVGCRSYFYACNGGTSTKLNCPMGLFFDPEELQCMNRDLIPICGGQKPKPTPAAPTQPTKAPDMWCRQNYKSDGFHGVGCSSYFYSCNAGFSLRINCPMSLFYDSKIHECSNKEWIPECGGTRPEPTTLPPMDATRPTTPPDLFCIKHNLEDGIHAVAGCASYFYTCNGGFSQRINCPNGLFYDVGIQQCAQRDWVPSCGGKRPLPTTTSSPQYTTPPDMWCQQYRKPDGFHGLGCATYFYSCTAGFSLKINCPLGLHYDPETHECNNKEFIPKCGGTRPEPTTLPPMDSTRSTTPPDLFCQKHRLPDGIHAVYGCANYFYNCVGGFSIKINCPANLFYDSGIQQCANRNFVPACGGKRPPPTTTTPASMNPTTPPDTYCRDYKLSDGVHGVGCNRFFYACNGGFSQKLNCPSNLFFDTEESQCMNREWIKACGGKKPPTTTQAPQLNPTTPPDTFCRDNKLPDGLHGYGCKNYFYACNGGFTTRLNCAGNTYFDPETKQCDHREWIVACGGQKTTTVAPPKNDNYNYLSYKGRQISSALDEPKYTTPPDLWCRQHNKANGMHSIGCSNYFYACNAGFSTRLTCPGNLYFDDQEQHCTHQEWIVACGGQKPTTLPPMLNPTGSTTPPDMWCQRYNMPDGLHAAGCKNYFYSCNGGFSTKLFCPSGLFFDPSEKQCTQRDWIEVCGGKKPVTLPPHLNPTKPTPPPDMWCQKNYKPDGFHGIGCTTYFYSCTAGFSLRINCPTGLYYDEGTHECNNKEFVPKCGGTRPEPTTLPPMDATQYTTPPDQFCSKFNLPDGIHAVNGCANFFYTCSGSFSIRISCPAGLFYDSELLQCTNRDWVPSCGGTRPAPTTTLAPTPTSPPDMWCQQNRKSDGFHGIGCATYFYSCNSGFSLRINCPGSLFYDQTLHECSNREWIPECGGKRPEPTTLPPMDATRPTTPPDTYCTDYKLKDGLHAVGCQGYFYSCNGGFSQRLSCPANLFFDPTLEQCTNKKWIPICGGTRPIPTTQPPQLNPTPPDTYCRDYKLSDGLHGVACNTFFYACNAGFSTKLECPGGLYFDDEAHECTNRAWVKACGGRRPPTTTTQQPQLNPTTPNPWCSVNRKSDGFHGDGCQAFFYICSAGMTNIIGCPNGLFYDAELQQCNNKHFIVACGGKKPIPTTEAPPQPPQPIIPVAQNPQQPYYPNQQPVPVQQDPPQSPRQAYPDIQQQQAAPRSAVALNIPPESQPLTPDTTRNPCVKLPNGIYGRRCSRHFFVCTNHTTFDFICPNNQAYDARVNKCAEKSQIATCASALNQTGSRTQYY